MNRPTLQPGQAPLAQGAPSAASPFVFMTETGVVLWTRYKADSLPSLLRGLQDVPGSSIYYHVHHALFRRRKIAGAVYANDLARWVDQALGQKGLAERLSSVDPLECSTVREARDRMASFLREYVQESEVFPRVPLGHEFHFMEARSFVVPTGHEAETLEQLTDQVQRVGPASILYHFIESRFRNGGENDFSQWLRERGEVVRADALRRINPYYYDMDVLRGEIVDALNR